MTAWLSLIFDFLLIVVVGTGVVQAIRLIRQLQDLRSSRAEMERFVQDFNSAVTRAEAGIKTLRNAARDSGDDLEKLVENANKVRDELTFIVESADGLAERLSEAASKAGRVDSFGAAKPSASEKTASGFADAAGAKAPKKLDILSTSRAEQELIQALKKLG